MRRFKRILHPTDFSGASAPALKLALDLARADRAELLIAHVINPIVPVAGEGYLSPRMYEDLARSQRAHAARQLDRLVARARKARARARPLLLEGSPHERITRAAKARRADLIVMGTHGRGAVARLFLGSVAERVVGSAPCPVLTIKGR
jgi:nucleotide-binding universal stress UspA family protein